MFPATFVAVASTSSRWEVGCESRGLVENWKNKRSKRGVLGGSEEPDREFSNEAVTFNSDGIGT